MRNEERLEIGRKSESSSGELPGNNVIFGTRLRWGNNEVFMQKDICPIDLVGMKDFFYDVLLILVVWLYVRLHVLIIITEFCSWLYLNKLAQNRPLRPSRSNVESTFFSHKRTKDHFDIAFLISTMSRDPFNAQRTGFLTRHLQHADEIDLRAPRPISGAHPSPPFTRVRPGGIGGGREHDVPDSASHFRWKKKLPTPGTSRPRPGQHFWRSPAVRWRGELTLTKRVQTGQALDHSIRAWDYRAHSYAAESCQRNLEHDRSDKIMEVWCEKNYLMYLALMMANCTSESY